MKKRIVVSNTSPIIALAKGEVVFCLKQIFECVYIPTAVKNECSYIETKKAIQNKVFLHKEVNNLLPISGIHQGEIEAISLAHELNIKTIILDDIKAIKKALQYNLKPISVFNVLLMAKKIKSIQSVKDVIDKMKKNMKVLKMKYITIFYMKQEN